MIRAERLAKSYGDHPVFSDFSFTVETGETVAFTGPSGSGKTTLLRILAGLEKADEGSVEGLKPADVAYQFQEPRLFGEATVLENLLVVCKDRRAALPRAKELLARFGLEEAETLLPAELSGGMKQRVSLLRAVLYDRPVLILDEPFTALDEKMKEELRAFMREYAKGKTLLLVSHDPDDLAFFKARCISLPDSERVS